jgi:hypothetical protein
MRDRGISTNCFEIMAVDGVKSKFTQVGKWKDSNQADWNHWGIHNVLLITSKHTPFPAFVHMEADNTTLWIQTKVSTSPLCCVPSHRALFNSHHVYLQLLQTIKKFFPFNEFHKAEMERPPLFLPEHIVFVVDTGGEGTDLLSPSAM